MKKIIIAGGGASGLMAAISAAKTAQENKSNVSITVLEKNSKLGKKIIASGNGKCNLSNSNVDFNLYNNPSFVSEVFNQFCPKQTLQFFNNSGLLLREDDEGRIYPYTNNSTSVVNTLISLCNKFNVKILTNVEILKISKNKNEFIVECNDETRRCDAVICSVGSVAGLNNAKDSIDILQSFNLQSEKIRPALCPLITSKKQVETLSGIRVKAKVSLLINNKKMFEEIGEVHFRENGLSGIVIFNASLYYQRYFKRNDNVKICLDLMPEYNKTSIIERFNKLQLSMSNFLEGIFYTKLAQKILNLHKDASIESISDTIKNYVFDITGIFDFKDCQVCVGGISTLDINCKTLESLLVPNLFFCGESINIDAPCGGYNLQWAWSSGFVAGKNSVR